VYLSLSLSLSFPLLTLFPFSPALFLSPSSLLGIDLDPQLITEAKKYHLNRLDQMKEDLKQKEETKEAEEEEISQLRKKVAAMERVQFRTEDFLLDESELEKTKQKFDIIFW
jgi:hypothetical protein